MRHYGIVREASPTPGQSEELLRAVGAVRFAQNWALDLVKSQLASGEPQSWSSYSLEAAWRRHRSEVAPWYSEVSKETFQYGCNRAAIALKNFSESEKGVRKGKKSRFPRFRKQGHNDSACFTSAKWKSSTVVLIPRIGRIRLKEPFTPSPYAKITGIIIRPRAGRWFVTFRIREDDWVAPEKKPIWSAVGVDAGMGDKFAALSDGTIVENPRFFRTDQARLSRVSKSLRRKKLGTKNRKKALAKVARVQYRTACKRADFIHKFTTNLVKTHDEIVIEDLNLQGMKSSLRLGKSVSDVAWGEVRRQLEYKSEWYGTTLTIVDKWFPSSKTCHVCGNINAELTLSDRDWKCETCYTVHDRDINAAKNLLAMSSLAGSSPVSACGENVRPASLRADLTETGSSIGDDIT